ncbi:MAG: spore protease YyaC [Tenericutes bacterium HGW-Tenericutes-4]|jgi:putative sporulation protein YyaC|nr:MAG: spore protease YyaC [Tenericutes bacterium HGW-Tenericutes-4]
MKEKRSIMLHKSHNLIYALQSELCEFIEKPIILCLGSDKVIADCLGPLVGHLLTKQYKIDAIVYGTLGRSIDKQNLEVYYNHITKTHKNKKILVIDASLGELEKFGTIQIKKGGLLSHGNNYVKPLGDVVITGIVLPNGVNYKYLIKETKLNFINSLAEEIAKIVYHSYKLMY